MNVKTGDIIQSYDFHFNTRSYSIGIVTSADEEIVNFDCIKQVWEYEIVDPSEYNPKMRTVQQGVLMNDEKFERILILA